MYYDFALLIPAGTTKAAPVKYTLKLTYGIICDLEVEFLAGCRNYAYLALDWGGHQLFPTNPDGAFNSEDHVIPIHDHFPLVTAPFSLYARVWAPDADYDHTVTVRISVLPPEVIYPYEDQMLLMERLLKYMTGIKIEVPTAPTPPVEEVPAPVVPTPPPEEVPAPVTPPPEEVPAPVVPPPGEVPAPVVPPVPVAPAKLEYTSALKTKELTTTMWGWDFEVDVTNTGGLPGTCHAIATLAFIVKSDVDSWGEDESVDMGTVTIEPGQTVTLKGRWLYASGPTKPPYEYTLRGIAITSEAGVITMTGVGGKLSASVQASVATGSEFWASLSLVLVKDMPTRVYIPILRLKPVPELKYIDGVPTDTMEGRWIGNWSGKLEQEIVRALIGPAGAPDIGIVLDHTGEYTIRGIYTSDVSGGSIYPHPVKATYLGYYTDEYGNTVGNPKDGNPYGEWPLPKGKYDVLCSLGVYTYGQYPYTGFVGYYAFQNLKVGEFQVV